MNSIRLIPILAMAGLASAGPIYDVTDLGTLGGSNAQAFSLNSSGQIVGAATTPFGDTHAFTSLSTGSGMTDLTSGTNATSGTAQGVNASGQIAGTQFIDGQSYATSWNGDAAQGTQIMGPAGSYGLAINDAGQTAGMLTSGGEGHAFIETNGVIQDLGDLPGGSWSSAYAINNAGEVAGYGQIGNMFRGFLWTPTTGYIVLGTFGGMNSYAMAVNDLGEVVGSADLADGTSNAFLSTGGALIDLGTLGGSSYAYGIDNSGEVVGYSYVDGAPHAFLYKDGAMLDLNDLLDPSDTGWVLTQAYAINAAGDIAGAAMFDGVEHAVFLHDPPGLLTAGDTSPVPEPAAWSVTLLGLACCASLSFRSRHFQFRTRLRPLRRDPPPAHSRSDA